MHEWIAELLGTFLLIYLGNGVVANAVLQGTKGHQAGWTTITFGWGFGVFVGVIVAGPYSGAHLNPAVSLGLAFTGQFAWTKVGGYIAFQLLGAMLGALAVWVHYRSHFALTPDNDTKLASFSTMPAVPHLGQNLFSEIGGTFVLIFVVLYLSGPEVELAANLRMLEGVDDSPVMIGLGSIGALPVALLVVGIGMSLGGTTGYAINPARDLGPRIVHSLLKVGGSSGWHYSWVPVVGPVIGAAMAAGLHFLITL